jgi:predicted phosphate transport protein (TIGR00153 family)
MRFDAIIKSLTPKEERFRGLLARETQNLLAGAKLFAELAASTSVEERASMAVQLKALEHDGDTITRLVYESLNSTFITPLDRDDIRSLASKLDDVLDHIEGVAQYIVLFELAEAPDALRQFAAILVGMAEEIDRATSRIWDLRHVQNIHPALVRVSELENQGDALYSTVIASLFKAMCKDSVDILKWKVVYDGLEDACDGCKDFTNVIGSILIKNA